MNATRLLVNGLLAGFVALAACSGDDDDGGSSGSGGSAGAGGGSGGVVQPAEMVELPGGFSIDSTEVTRAQYAAWLDTDPDVGAQPDYCKWNTTYEPGCKWPPGDEPNHPVECVDWCDAYAYCAGVGKRLCGKIDGGAEDYDDGFNSQMSQWLNACSAGGVNDYPWGSSVEGTECAWVETAPDGPVSVGSYARCQSSAQGYEGVYDLLGNVEEWVDACGTTEGAEDRCLVRGAPYYLSAKDCQGGAPTDRDETAHGLGFRCCS